jgi:hypothetical protein
MSVRHNGPWDLQSDRYFGYRVGLGLVGHRNVLLDLLMMVGNLKNLVQADEGRRDGHC